MNSMNFGAALDAIKAGLRIARAGWNGKGMFVYLVPAASYPVQTGAAKAHFGDGAMVPYNAYMAIKNVDNTVSTWVPSVNDCLATDWGVVGGGEQAAINESSHDWRHSSSYGGQLCADCGAVKGSRRGGLECRDPNAGVATAALPVVDHGPDSLERSRADTHASAVLYPAIKLAMDEMDLDPLLSPSVNARRAYNALFDAFWSEAPAPTSEMAKRRPDNPTAESADFLASVKACDLSSDAPCEACQ